MTCLSLLSVSFHFFFFFTDPATTEIYTLSLHDALPILAAGKIALSLPVMQFLVDWLKNHILGSDQKRSEEHTSELQSRGHLVCRLLLEKKKKKKTNTNQNNKPNKKENQQTDEHSHNIYY